MGSWSTRRARMSPDAVALSQDGVDRTYREVEQRATRYAHALRARGVERGDRVAFLGLNSLDFIEVMFAVAKLGAVFLPLNTRLAPPETAFILADAQPRMLVWDAPFAGDVDSPQVSDLRLDRIAVHPDGTDPTLEALLTEGSKEPLDEPISRDDPFMIQYTSGTSGRPKGVLLTHENIHFNVYNMMVDVDVSSSEVALVAAPLFHTAALNEQFFPTFLKGGRALIEARFDPARVLQLIGSERVTFVFGVTSMYQAIMRVPGWEAADLSSVKIALSGGSPLPESLLRAWLDRGLMIMQAYGMTETSPGLTMLREADGVAKVGSAGTACFFSDVRVVTPMLDDVTVGEPGEVLAEGPNVTPGYWRNDAATTEAFVDGWLRSGDLARVDDDGFLTIVGRVKDMIISGGENVYPVEVEAAIYTHPAVAEVAVIGVPDPTWGEVGRAVATLKAGASATEAELLAHLDGRIARYKIPKSVVVVEALPHNASGKLIKGPLRQTYGALPPPAPKEAP